MTPPREDNNALHPKHGRLRRAVAVAGWVAGLGVVFALAGAGGVALHLPLPAPRRFATARVNEILGGTFKGTVKVERVGGLRLTALDGVDAEVFDPEGHRVLTVRNLHARIGTFSLVRSLAGSGDLAVRIPSVEIDSADVVLDQNAAGDIGLLQAFESRAPSQAPSRATDVTVPRIRLHHAWVHGHLNAVPVLDADLDGLAASFASTAKSTDIDVEDLAVRGRGIPGVNPDGKLVARASLPASGTEDRKVGGHYDGRVGDVRVHAEGSLADQDVTAIVDVPETAPEAFAAFAQNGIRVKAPVTAHVEARGRLPVLAPDVHVRIGDGTVAAAGTVTLPDGAQKDLSVVGKVDLSNLDASLAYESAPMTALNATATASVIIRAGGDMAGTFRLDNRVGRVADQVVPAMIVQGELAGRSVHGSAHIDELGAPTDVRFALDPKEGGSSPSVLDIHTDTAVADLDAIARAGRIGHGRARVRVDGRMDLDTKTVSAKANAELARLDLQGVALGRGFVTVAAEGPLDSPRLDAVVRGSGLRAAGYAFPALNAHASGSPREMDVNVNMTGDDRSPNTSARAHLAFTQSVLVTGARVDLAREDVHTTTTIRSIHVSGGKVDIVGTKIEGLGEPIEAWAHLANGSLKVRAKASDVDVARVLKLAARSEDARGHLALDVDMNATRRGAKGTIDVSLRDLSVGSIDDANLRVTASMNGRRASGDVRASVRDLGDLHFSASDVALGGMPTDPSAWKAATGAVQIAGNVDLAALLARIPEGSRPVGAASGKVSITGEASRPSVAASPSLSIKASTNGLSITGIQQKYRNADGTVTLGPAPWTTTGVDGAVALDLDARTGHTAVSADVHDAHGALASVGASTRLPLAEILRAPEKLASLVRDLPFEANASIPKRSLDSLPPVLGELPVRGEAELSAEVRGTMRAPAVTLTAHGLGLLPRGAPTCVTPTDVGLTVHYDGEKADAKITAERDGQSVMDASAVVKVSAAQAESGGPLAWEASGDVALASFPLDTAGVMLSQPIAGAVSGKIHVRDLHRAGSLEADLDLHDLSLDHAAFPSGKIRVSMKDGAATASARLEQKEGFGEVRATGAMAWGAAVAPSLDLAKPIDVAIRAEGFRADAATPFVAGVFSELDGRIDADARLHVEAGGRDGHVDGAITIRDGVFEVPQIGERFHDVGGRVIMKPWGTLRFDDFTASAPTGKLTASGSVVLKGLAMQTADARIDIPRGESIPIAFEGVPVGRAYGNITAHAKASQDGDRIDVALHVPVLHVDLPTSTSHVVQPLEPDTRIRVGARTDGDFVVIPFGPPEKPRPPSSLVIHTTVKLGDDVVVRRGTEVNVAIEGNVGVDVTDKTRVSGEIRLTRGTLEIQGKRFSIDRATVSFAGSDPSDPIVLATAYWDGPDGTRVFADFSGHVTTGRLGLRSEPALTQDEILALILFGSPDGSFGAQPPPGQEQSRVSQAAGMAGGVVTQGLNKAISGITTVDISTRIDTSEANSPRPELSVQISKNVSARLGYKLGVPAPGENPDRTDLTLDWRFVRNWSLTAVVGDQGSTALDVVWRYRY